MDSANPPMEYAAPRAGESTADFRSRVAQHQAEAVEFRRRSIAEQTSDAHPPAERIRIWEKLHHVVLPRNPNHRVLRIVAARTGLTLDDVRAEQRLRLTLAAKPVT